MVQTRDDTMMYVGLALALIVCCMCLCSMSIAGGMMTTSTSETNNKECPAGMTKYGDGSACKGGDRPNCALWGNKTLPRCHNS